MARVTRLFRHPDTWVTLFLAAWPFLYFWSVTLGQSVWFTTDIIRLFYPFSVELARALGNGHLPLWAPGMLGGFPLLAEGEVGALYPVNLVLFKLLPVHFALAYAILLHLAWAGCGMYAYVRSLKVRPLGALLAGFVFSFSSFIFGHLSHSAVIATTAWLPWLLFFQNRLIVSLRESLSLRAAPFAAKQSPPESRLVNVGDCFASANPAEARNDMARARNDSTKWFILTSLAFGIQFLPGSAQVAFFNSIVFVLAGILGEWLLKKGWSNDSPFPKGKRGDGLGGGRWGESVLAPMLLSTALPALLGAGIAAVQLFPTAELVRYSVRGETSQDFFTSYSLPLGSLAGFFWPFLNGEPAEGTGEFWTYFGLTPLLLALSAPLLRRDRRTIATFVFGLVALSLALGGSNPLYSLLYQLPIFGMFRVPARFLHLVIFAGACLSALALDEWSRRLDTVRSQKRLSAAVALAFALLTACAIGLVYSQGLEFWLGVWKFLPVVLALALGAIFLVSRTRRLTAGSLGVLLIGVSVFDLAAFAPPFLATIDALTPPSYVEAVPRSITSLGLPRVTERVFTDLSIFPSVPALRGSLFPNVALSNGWSSAQSYTSLALARQQAYVFDPSPAMLNLMNVRYLMIPLEPRPANRSSAPSQSFGLDVLDNEVVISPTLATAVLLTSYTEQASELPEGAPVGELVLRYEDGNTSSLPIRSGIETADWDAERKNPVKQGDASRLQIAHKIPGFWRAFGRAFDGFTYKATQILSPAKRIVGVTVHPLVPEARLVVESVSLVAQDGTVVPLATLSGRDRFELAYLSDTVAVWENLDVMPRAFLVHAAEVLDDDSMAARLKSAGFRPEQVVLIDQGQPQTGPVQVGNSSERVEITGYEADRVSITISTDRAGYLVLCDSWYPGWDATVDGKNTPISRADLIFRAVPVPAGEHSIVFEYRPFSFILGAIVSGSSLLVVGGLLLIVQSHR